MKRVTRTLASGERRTYVYDRRPDPGVVTVRDVMTEYLSSADFRRLKPSTQAVYRRALDCLREFARSPVMSIRRRHILAHRDTFLDRPGMGNQVLNAWATLLAFAVDREHIPATPYTRIRRLPSGHHARWSDAQIDVALSKFPAWASRAVMLALYTGQREADVCAMTWSDWDHRGGTIRVVQQKTGARLMVPVHSRLADALATWRPDARSVTILAQKRNGQPWKVPTFASLIGREIDRHDELGGLVFHGLRMSAAARLAEAGCTVHEIAAITGHRTLDMIALYTREVEQERNARAAIVKLEQRK
jgi:integrase